MHWFIAHVFEFCNSSSKFSFAPVDIYFLKKRGNPLQCYFEPSKLGVIVRQRGYWLGFKRTPVHTKVWSPDSWKAIVHATWKNQLGYWAEFPQKLRYGSKFTPQSKLFPLLFSCTWAHPKTLFESGSFTAFHTSFNLPFIWIVSVSIYKSHFTSLSHEVFQILQ